MILENLFSALYWVHSVWCRERIHCMLLMIFTVVNIVFPVHCWQSICCMLKTIYLCRWKISACYEILLSICYWEYWLFAAENVFIACYSYTMLLIIYCFLSLSCSVNDCTLIVALIGVMSIISWRARFTLFLVPLDFISPF